MIDEDNALYRRYAAGMRVLWAITVVAVAGDLVAWVMTVWGPSEPRVGFALAFLLLLVSFLAMRCAHANGVRAGRRPPVELVLAEAMVLLAIGYLTFLACHRFHRIETAVLFAVVHVVVSLFIACGVSRALEEIWQEDDEPYV